MNKVICIWSFFSFAHSIIIFTIVEKIPVSMVQRYFDLNNAEMITRCVSAAYATPLLLLIVVVVIIIFIIKCYL